MARTAPQLLLCLHGQPAERELAQLAETLSQSIEGDYTVLALADHAEEASALLERAQGTLAPRLAGARFKAHHGSASHEILREVAEGHYDVVIVRGAAGAARGDDLAEEVARRAAIPVLVLKGERPTLDRLLLCTAAGEPGKLDILFGGRLARHVGAQATLLHVSPNGGSAAPDGLSRHLEQGVRTLHGQGVRADFKVRHGAILDEIIAEAREGNHDMIVVGGHIDTAPLPFMENDLAAQVVRLADRPVLVVRGELA